MPRRTDISSFLIACALATAAIAVVPVHGQQPLPSTIVVEAADNREPLIFLGLLTFGSETDLRRVEAAAKARGIIAGWPNGSDDPPEVMILFTSRTARSDALAFYRAVRDGEYGTLRVELVIAPARLAADGINLDTEVRAVAPSQIVEPES